MKTRPANDNGKRPGKGNEKSHRYFLVLSIICLISTSLAVAYIFLHNSSVKPIQSAPESNQLVSKSPRVLSGLLALKPADLKELDIGLMNLLCAEGLRGAEKLYVDQELRLLDAMFKWLKIFFLFTDPLSLNQLLHGYNNLSQGFGF